MTILLLESLHADAEQLLAAHASIVRASEPNAPPADLAAVQAILTRGRGRIGSELLPRCPSLRVVARAKQAGVIDLAPWGRVRRLPSGTMQMFVRDPSGNLIEIGSQRGAVIDAKLFADELVEPKPGMYRMAPGASIGRHETP